MPLTFNQSKDEIARLVKHFAANRAQYVAAAYKEEHARHEFIDTLFMALNWDVHNHQQAAPDYREVITEDSLEIEGQRKAPDYAFRVGKERKFFGEAKKPGVDLKNTPGPAYQLRRYAWSAKLPLSLLTDFEELAVYDCRARPADKDKASVARVNYLTFEEYADRWQEVWEVFSREAVWGGSFDQYAAAGKGKRGTTEVDAEFLKEIEGWREVLARNLALRNPKLTIDQLNDAVQRTIDRIIFLRMAEDRGVEEYGRLQRLAGGDDAYAGLLDLARQADAKYNSGLFDFSKAGDRVTPGLALDDKVLKPLLAGLYFPQCPYEFSVLPAEILGNVYEQFLGKVIRLTSGHQAKVEEKPEVKKSGGVRYTPTYISTYLVLHTVGKQVEGKSPRQLKDFRVLDMSCGSGSILLCVFQFLLDYYLSWYVANSPGQHPEAVWLKGEVWRLTTAERKRILTRHIFGVDIDRQAVEVTKLSLLLKVLEGENDESLGKQLALIQERVLPNLDRNIKCGNSLIGPDYFAGQLMPDPDEMRRVNAFDWAAEFPEVMRAGGFDCVIGNPPYIRIQVMQEWAPLEVEIYKQLYATAASGNYDIYVVFVEKGLSLLNKSGRLGFILPHKFFNAQYGAALRKLLAEGRHLAHVVHFGDQQVFAGVTTYTCLMFLSKAGVSKCDFRKVDDLGAWRLNGQAIAGEIPAASITETEWNFAVGEGAALFERLSQMPVKLANIASKIFQGLVTSSDPVYLLEPVGSSTRGKLVKVRSKATDQEYDLEIGVVWPLCKGARDIRRYHATPSKRVLFPYDSQASASTGKTILIPEKTFSSQFPKAWAYLKENYDTLRDREKGKMRHDGWYGYVYPKSVTLFGRKKILTPSIAANACYTLDAEGQMYFVGSGGGGGGGYGIVLADDSSLSYEYVLGLLNSKLLNSYLKKISSPFSGGYYAYNRQYIEQLPIRPINFSDPADKDRHDTMVTLVEQMLDLHQRKAEAKDAAGQELLQRLIDATDRQIDVLVYALYDLTPEEIAVVEGAR